MFFNCDQSWIKSYLLCYFWRPFPIILETKHNWKSSLRDQPPRFSSLVKTLIHRALKYCHSWHSFRSEINRLKQLFSNNSYPLSFVENMIHNCISKFIAPRHDSNSNEIKYFVQLQNLPSFKQDAKRLKSIFRQYISATDNSTISVQPYYKPKKLSSLFSTRARQPDDVRTNVVYQYSCNEAGCNATYIGHTTNALAARVRQHRYRQSSIHAHLQSDHQQAPPSYDQFIAQFKIMHSFPVTIDLKIAESLCIKTNNPFINIKYNELSSFLKLF